MGKLLLRQETTDYRLGCFSNATMNIHKLQNEEMDAIQNMVLQHQMALDFLTAEQGGLCVMLNTTCCSYIPDNFHSPNMTIAMKTQKTSSDQLMFDCFNFHND